MTPDFVNCEKNSCVRQQFQWEDARNPCVRSVIPAVSPPEAMALTSVCAEPGPDFLGCSVLHTGYAWAWPCPTTTPELLIPNSSVDCGAFGNCNFAH